MKVSNVVEAVRIRARSAVVWVAVLLSLCLIAGTASAQIIERIDINRAGNDAEISIQFASRIQYVRNAQLKNGDLRIYLNLLDVDALDPRLVQETRDAPPSEIAPHFTVTYPEYDSALTVRFGKMVDCRIRIGRDGHSIIIVTPAIKPKSEPALIVPPVAPPVPVITPPVIVPSIAIPDLTAAGKAAPAQPVDMEQEAKQLIDGARAALKKNQTNEAIEVLNRLLNMPPNRQSQPAQALIGEAREKQGEFAKARAEYELYLKLYPDAADVNRIKEKLARLPGEKDGKKQSVTGTVEKAVAEEKMTVFGSFSQSYSKGISHTDETNLGIPTATLTSIDQSQLISSLDLSARKRTETLDTRMVLRDTHSWDFLPGQKNARNRLNTAYIEQGARDRSYRYRLGRQTGTSGGIPGRFDGGMLSYNLDPIWRVNGVLGTPVEFTGAGVDRKTFVGMSVDLTRSAGQWNGSGYFMEQRAAGVTDRRVVGMEARYFDQQRNYTGLLDYDTLFKALNIAMFQGNWTNDDGRNYFLLMDHRKSPPLALVNALPAQTMPSIDALITSGVSQSALRADAQAQSTDSNLFMVGMTHPYSKRMQLGGDFRVSNTTGTRASGTLPGNPGTANSYTVSVQAVGHNLLLENDLGVASVSYTKAPTYKAQSVAFTQVETFRQNWRLDLALQLSSQTDNLNVRVTKVMPNLKLSYRMSDMMSFEGEGGLEDSHTTSSTQDSKTRRSYFSMGYRWDF